MERPIAQLAQLYYNSRTEGHKHLPRDRFELYGKQAAPLRVTANAAAVFFALGGGGQLPGWATIPEVGEQMNAADRSGTVPELSALIGDRAVLLCPTIHKDMIACEYAIVDKGAAMEEVIVANLKTGEEYRIVIEQSGRSALTADDARFKRVKPPEIPATTIPAMPVTTR